MGAIKESGGMLNSIMDDEGDEEEASINSRSGKFFEELKSYCIELLELVQHPKKNPTSAISSLLQLLRRSSSDSLQPFFEYILFPLLLLYDAAVECRTKPKGDAKESIALETPHKVSDAVAEGVVCCLEELLNKCYLQSVDQMVVMLKKLTHGALLSPMEASEEFREGVIRSFRALLINLRLCSDESCSCKQIAGCPALLETNSSEPLHVRVLNFPPKPEECLIAFLQSEAASAAIGHWLSLLLKAAESEALRGHRGSAALRVNAFKALRMLVAKVGTADALAFFLPGVVSQIGKVLHMSKTMISGAAGSTEALDQAIRALSEYLMIALNDNAILSSPAQDNTTELHSNKEKSPVAILEKLHHLSVKTRDQGEIAMKEVNEAIDKRSPLHGLGEMATNSHSINNSFRVNRSMDWITNTSSHIDKLLSATFPHLCVHPTKKVRQGILAAIQGLLSKCSSTLRESRLMLLECLCILVCDDSEEVASVAQAFLGYCLSSRRHYTEHDITEVLNRLVEKLPKVVLGSEETLALSNARILLVVIYYLGPKHVRDYLLQSPVKVARFLDTFAVCLSQNSIFAGSLDKLVLTRPSSSGYMYSIEEMKAIIDSQDSGLQSKRIQHPTGKSWNQYELPRMPPWFMYVGSEKLYKALAGVLRLVSRSLFAGSQSEGSLSVIIDIPLGYFRKLVSDVRMKQYSDESWQSWYSRTGSGQLVRQASTAACILNEMIFGLSDQAISVLTHMFQGSSSRFQEELNADRDNRPLKSELFMSGDSSWIFCQEEGARSHLIDCIGQILHEYLSPEVWDLPVELPSSSQHTEHEYGEITFHFFNDNAMLKQVVIDGIGIFNMCLQKEFSSCGFLHSSLYLLLENLICSNFQIRTAADAVLHVISATHDYPTVGHLVLANSDYIIDSVCRQLRHLDLNPQVPNVLAAMLSYIGVAHKILPLLEEPMRAASVELEILGRYQHPDLTLPFLKAVAEITKASKDEACKLPNQAESFYKDVKCRVRGIQRKLENDSSRSTSLTQSNKDMDLVQSETEVGICSSEADMQEDLWESIFFTLNDSKRYRRTVGSIAGSCLTAATPLLTSTKQAACLLALDTIEDGVLALAKVEEAYKHEKATKEAIEKVLSSCSFYNVKYNLDAAEDEAGENRLLPAVNKIWPFLVACIRNKIPVVVRRCLHAVNNIVQICGGDFFARRFHIDGIHFWELLSASPFHKKPISKQQNLRLPYRSTAASSKDDVAEVSDIKVQEAVLNMIADLAGRKRTASALEAVLKKVSGLVVGIACSGVTGLQEASINALAGLASVDSDLIWVLLADVYYSKNNALLPPAAEFPQVSQILPPPSSSKGYLYVMYGGRTYGFDIDFPSVETAFMKLYG